MTSWGQATASVTASHEVRSGLDIRTRAHGSAMISCAIGQLLGTDQFVFWGPAGDCAHPES